MWKWIAACAVGAVGCVVACLLPADATKAVSAATTVVVAVVFMVMGDGERK